METSYAVGATIAATNFGPSSTLLVFALVFAFLGFRSARNFRNVNGVTPWGAPSLLWGLMCGFSWLIGVILLWQAKKSTQRDLFDASNSRVFGPGQQPGTEGSPKHSRRRRIITATCMFALGPVLIVVGIVELASAGHTDLTALTVASPGQGMSPASIGDGGSAPTHVFPESAALSGAGNSAHAPTTPLLYLQPVRLTDYGIPTGTESAYWKVWWDSVTKEQDVISLQQHVSDTNASQEVAYLSNLNKTPAALAGGPLSFNIVSSFSVPAIADSDGHVWRAQYGRLQIELRFVVFQRGSVVALVSSTGFGTGTDAAAFDLLALSEYTQMGSQTSASLPAEASGVAVGLGFALLLAGVIALIGACYKPLHVAPERATGPSFSYPQTGAVIAGLAASAPDSSSGGSIGFGASPGAGWYPDPSGVFPPGTLRYWDGKAWTDATTQPRTEV